MHGMTSRDLARKESERPIDDEVAHLARRFRTYVERERGPLAEYVPEHYTTILADGIDYVITIRIGPNKHVKLGVRKSLDKGEDSVLFLH